MELPPCPRCARNWSTGRDGDLGCLLHGDYVAVIPAGEEPKSEGGWSDVEESYVQAHLADRSFRQLSDDLRAMGYQRTQKAVEHLVYQRGWSKKYVRLRPDQLPRLPRGLAPADRAVAVIIRERALNGWAVSMRQIAEATGLHIRQVPRAIRRLVDRGLVEVGRSSDAWHGHRPNSYRWVVTDSVTRVGAAKEEEHDVAPMPG